MKTLTLLSRLALVGLVASIAGITTGIAALPLFAATISTLLLMIMFLDYQRPVGITVSAPSRCAGVPATRTCESHPLAA